MNWGSSDSEVNSTVVEFIESVEAFPVPSFQPIHNCKYQSYVPLTSKTFDFGQFLRD